MELYTSDCGHQPPPWAQVGLKQPQSSMEITRLSLSTPPPAYETEDLIREVGRGWEREVTGSLQSGAPG